MSYLVVAYPKLENTDFNLIQDYRKDHDLRYYSLIKPHVTLVFAIDNIAEKAFIQEVEEKITNFSSFKLTFNVATINLDNSGEFYHEFLVPDIGNSDIIKLHDKLYSGLFKTNLRLDIDYIPHISIGNSDDVETTKARIDKLNNAGVAMTGEIDSIDIIEYKDNNIATIKHLKLIN